MGMKYVTAGLFCLLPRLVKSGQAVEIEADAPGQVGQPPRAGFEKGLPAEGVHRLKARTAAAVRR